ncbi:hypothetical protein RHGRI_038691 [Rhododendron griersonianum]|uniref:ATPase AAA-type core domain-containing protein n=1 Tax=Rhododendron griersonianum TaxID=479676 RepID=A0AAV6HP01_9ERIC|nr:hypothetical protein RHGRI_038691 [Rhododendron griersonianum]
MREASWRSRRQGMLEGVLSLVDSTTKISSMDFDAPDNNAHRVRAYQSGPIVFNSEKVDAGEGLNRESLTKSALSLDDSTKPRSLPNSDATENKAVKVYTGRGRGCWHSLEELEQRMTLEELGMDPENEGIISDLLRFVSDKEEFYKKADKDWKRGYLLYDSPGTDRSSLIAAMANRLEFDIYDLDLTGLTSISELTNVLVSIRNCSLIAIKDFDHWVGMLPNLKNESPMLFCKTSCSSIEICSDKFNELRLHMPDSPAWKSFEVLDSLPLGERSNSIRHLARRRTLTHKHCVRLKKSQDLLRSLQRDCSGGLAPQKRWNGDCGGGGGGGVGVGVVAIMVVVE